ncbi:hypothetical protein OS493_013448 [Desmophyllum pertusum]|uniref:Uncharacterized protein n=1 Tax=Desmophyllum pertusum TaxID=174260 RepID=A0A9W9YDM4_9CNID|nr:hypothetical protein OS493_013448 [Desmophyllum pertusum]
MLSTLKRKVVNVDAEPKGKKICETNPSVYASIRAWILANYEVEDGSLIFNNDLVEHARKAKENLSDEGYTVTANILGKALREVFGDHTAKNHSFEEDWQKLVGDLDGAELQGGVNGGWSAMTNNDVSFSYLRFGNQTFNNQKAVIEIKFEKNVKDEKIDTAIIYHERVIPSEDVANIEKHLSNELAVDKARKLMQLMDDDSNICQGNQLEEDEFDLCQLAGARRHRVLNATGVSEERVFSSECKVLTNFAGTLCSKCQQLARNMCKRKKRRQEEVGMERKIKSNHRYMSREQILLKLDATKKKYLAEKRKREKVEEEMLEMEEEDHFDLKEMMRKVDKEDVPEDMVLFWEQQQKIFSYKLQ